VVRGAEREVVGGRGSGRGHGPGDCTTEEYLITRCITYLLPSGGQLGAGTLSTV
jgi:hypothetical protein